MLLFWKLVDETQNFKPREPSMHRTSIKLLILLPVRADFLCTLQCEIHYEKKLTKNIRLCMYVCMYVSKYISGVFLDNLTDEIYI